MLLLLQQIQRDAEITAEDEQVFLMRQQTQLSKQAPAGARVSDSLMCQDISCKLEPTRSRYTCENYAEYYFVVGLDMLTKIIIHCLVIPMDSFFHT